jgi:hypothetical protein
MGTINARDAIAHIVVMAVTWGWRSGVSTRAPLTSTGLALVLYTPLLYVLYGPFISPDIPYLFLAFPIAFVVFACFGLFAAAVFYLPTTLNISQSFVGYSIIKPETRTAVSDFYTPFAAALIQGVLAMFLGGYLVARPSDFSLTDASGIGLGVTALVLGFISIVWALFTLLTTPAEYAFLFHFVSIVWRAVIDLIIFLTRTEIGLPWALFIGGIVDVMSAIIDVFYWQNAFGLASNTPQLDNAIADGYSSPSPLSFSGSYKWSIIYSVILTTLPATMYFGSAIAVQTGTESRAARTTWTALVVFGIFALIYIILWFWKAAPKYYSIAARRQLKGSIPMAHAAYDSSSTASMSSSDMTFVGSPAGAAARLDPSPPSAPPAGRPSMLRYDASRKR